MAQSFAELLQSTRQMATALTTNQAEMANRGLTPEFIADGQEKIAQLEALDVEQEALKAALKAKTAEVNTALKALNAWQKESKQIVKLTYSTQQEKWIEFGIKDKR